MPAEVTRDEDKNANLETQVVDQLKAQETPPVEKAAEVKTDAPKGEEKSGEDAAPAKTPLEAAKRVMAKEQKQGSETKPQVEAQKPNPEEKPKGEEDDAELPFKDHPTYRKLRSEHRMLRVAKEKNEEAIRSLEPKGKTFDELTTYLQTNNLGRDDFASGLSIMTAIRNDPIKGYEMLKPVLDKLEEQLGIRLPPELKAQVDAGQITPEVALEISRSRSGERIATSRANAVQERMAREQAERDDREAGAQQEAQLDVVVQAINTAERDWSARDPDAAKLRPALEDRLLAVGGMTPPRNAEEAKKLFDECLAHVKKMASGWAPAPRAKDGVLPVSGASTTITSPVPKSSLDAARAALTSA